MLKSRSKNVSTSKVKVDHHDPASSGDDQEDVGTQFMISRANLSNQAI